MVRSHRLLSFDLHTYVHPDGPWHSRLICSLVCQMKKRYTCSLSGLKYALSTNRHGLQLSVSCSIISAWLVRSSHPSLILPFLLSEKLTQVVPNVHLPTQSADFDDGLTQEVIALTFEPLFHSRLDVVILVPNTNFDAIRRVVAFAGWDRDRNCQQLWCRGTL